MTDEADTHAKMQIALSQLGLSSFRPGQAEIIEATLSGRDALVVLPTGGGKSLTYQVPSLVLDGLTVVVSPLIALMSDQQKRMAHLGAVAISSAQSDLARAASLEQLKNGQAKIVFVAPERFTNPSFMRLLKNRGVDLFVVDEAHCIIEMGHDFRPDYLRLTRVLGELGRPTVLALTATATKQIAREITGRLRLRDPFLFHGGFDRPNISFDVVPVSGDEQKLALLSAALKLDEMRPAIVYCATRKDTEAVTSHLRMHDIQAIAYHGGMESGPRARNQRRFMSDREDVVVATSAFGMGVDKGNIRSVWHYALPPSMEGYYQQIGRAGRDGERARAVLLACKADRGILSMFNQQRHISIERFETMFAKLVHLTRGSENLEMEMPVEAAADVLEAEVVVESEAEQTEEVENHRFELDVVDDQDRIILGIMERIGALRIEAAPQKMIIGSLRTEVLSRKQMLGAVKAIKHTVGMGWRAYRAINDFAFGVPSCRRQQVLAHFGDEVRGAPLGRCCDVCHPPAWRRRIQADVAAELARPSGPARVTKSGDDDQPTVNGWTKQAKHASGGWQLKPREGE